MQVSLLLVDWLHPQFQPRGDIFDGGTLCLGGVDILQHLGQPALHQRMTLGRRGAGTPGPIPGSPGAERIDPRCHCPAQHKRKR